MRAIYALLLIITLSVLILFTSIDTKTLFTGTHLVTDISSDENDIDCTWCHSWIANELTSSSVHSNFKCEECHRLVQTAEGEVIKYALHNQATIQVGNQSHAAYTPECLDCHGGGGVYYNDTNVQKNAPVAPAFNQLNYGSDYSAHKPLVQYADAIGTSFGENEACLACHTNYSTRFEYNRPDYFDFKINYTLTEVNFYVNEIGSLSTTIIINSDTGAKHEFKSPGDIKCESCHSDIWQAANHISGVEGTAATNASHVCWQWDSGVVSKDSPMHNVTCVYSEYGISYYSDTYDNITEYCTLSCHKPNINPAATAPPIFQETVHSAYRISCYNCHNSSTYTTAIYNQPMGAYDTPDFKRTDKHDEIDDVVLSDKLFLNAETCIACKRDGGAGSRYKTWTEPDNEMYDVDDGNYI